jgi:hypothetical protein
MDGDGSEERLMDAPGSTNRTRILFGLGAAIVVIAVVLGVLALTGDDDTDVDTSGTTTTSAVATTTTAVTTTTAGSTVDVSQAMWPRAGTSQRFDDPVSAARSFAVDFVGMIEPVMGDFQAGDSRSGEVEVRPLVDGPVTTVFVRQLQDDTWFVLGAVTENVTLASPEVGATIECPLTLTGEALAFEGTVAVAIRDDVSDEPIGTGFVTGGGTEVAPFEGQVDCDLSALPEGDQYGSIVLTTEGGEDGRAWQAAAVRVRLQ